MADNPLPCFRCGVCCIAPDISTLGKPVGVPCIHLREDMLCGIYANRPPVCREYKPDETCRHLQTLPPNERVTGYLEIFDLTDESTSGHAQT